MESNGIVYVNTNRVMTDGHRDNSVGERKLIWDEENRLLAVDDNGFVSNYWYDADGERTVKTSGESDQVYVNGVFSGGSTNTAKFSLYVSPYLVANQGGRYTKHIYAGSQRIVSKVGDFASYGSDPRRIEYAGANTDGLSVDYKSKYAAQQQVIRDNYKFFDVPYNGTDNDNYADGEGFCCNDGSMEAAVAEARKTQIRAVSRSFKDPDNYENLQFFYHPDHLGSSSFITNLDGEVVQHIEYVPFGEVFIEERNNVWNTPYLFNAKEFDEETGLYYYGARYYNPRLSIWISPDNLQEKLPEFSTYTYTHNNPIKYIDPDGNIPVETVWDAANVALGVSTLIDNIKQGNVGAAVVDGLGVIVDAAATVVPYVPGLVQELNPIGLVKLWLILLRQLKQQLMPQKQLRLQKQLKPQLKVHPTLQEEPLLGRLKEMQEYQQVKISKPIPKEMLRKMEEAGVKVLNMNLTFQLHMDLKKVDSCRIISKVISIWMVELIILLISIFIKNKERLN